MQKKVEDFPCQGFALDEDKNIVYSFAMTHYKAKTATATLALYDFVFTLSEGILGESSKWVATIKFSKTLGSITRPAQTWEVERTLHTVEDVRQEIMRSLMEYLHQNMTPQIETSDIMVESEELLSDEVDDEDEIAPVIFLRKDLTET